MLPIHVIIFIMKKKKKSKQSTLPARYKKLISNLLSSINHDFRSPAASIKNAIEILDKDLVDNVETKKEFLNIISDENNHIIELIKDTITAFKIDLGLQKWDFQVLELSRLISGITENCPILIQKKNQTLKIEHWLPFSTKIKIDFNRFIQLFEILISNASKFSDNHQEILIDFAKNKKGLEIKVQDNGIGIPPDLRRSIFKKLDPHKYPSHKPKGTGVGLYLAKKIVEAHKGEITFESTHNRGATFYITIPIKK